MSAPVVDRLYEGRVPVVTRPCPQCGEVDVFHLDAEAVARWRAGELTQRAFPALAPPERERLISGTCGPCWKALFSDDDEYDG